MLRSISAVALVAVCATVASAQEAAPAAGHPVKTFKERVSYMIGLSTAEQLKSDGVEFDQELIIRGLRDGLNNVTPPLSEEEMQATAQEYSRYVMNKRAEAQMATNPELKAMADKNKADGAAYLAENAKKEGVVVLPSGLQYKVVSSGAAEGASPNATDTVQTHYRGTLIDGTVFDSSYDNGQPATFQVGQVIPGWTEALQKMKPGDKWEVYIPSDLAYGVPGRMPRIGPNSALVFTVELISVTPTLPEPKN